MWVWGYFASFQRKPTFPVPWNSHDKNPWKKTHESPWNLLKSICLGFIYTSIFKNNMTFDDPEASASTPAIRPMKMPLAPWISAKHGGFNHFNLGKMWIWQPETIYFLNFPMTYGGFFFDVFPLNQSSGVSQETADELINRTMGIERSTIGISRKTGSIIQVAMDQYLYIPFLGGWTSINPSYFDVHQGDRVLTHPQVIFKGRQI